MENAVTIEAPSLLDALQPVLPMLDSCYWWIGGEGFQTVPSILERYERLDGSKMSLAAPLKEQLDELKIHLKRHGHSLKPEDIRLYHWIDLYVKDTVYGRVGFPGFFSRLGDCVDHMWSTFYVIKAETLPEETLHWIHMRNGIWDQQEPLPDNVVMIVSFIDCCMQQFTFKDASMRKAVTTHAIQNRWRLWENE
ncbi:MAG: hypothetical protein U0796_08470 [Gemmatales bacterium]